MTTGAGKERTDTLPPSSVAMAPEDAVDPLEETDDRDEDGVTTDSEEDSIDQTDGR